MTNTANHLSVNHTWNPVRIVWRLRWAQNIQDVNWNTKPMKIEECWIYLIVGKTCENYQILWFFNKPRVRLINEKHCMGSKFFIWHATPTARTSNCLLDFVVICKFLYCKFALLQENCTLATNIYSVIACKTNFHVKCLWNEISTSFLKKLGKILSSFIALDI